MRHGEARHQKSVEQFPLQMELTLEERGETPTAARSGEALPTTQGNERLGLDSALMERVVERGNLLRALQRVRQNKGSPGVDVLTVEDLREYRREHGCLRPRQSRCAHGTAVEAHCRSSDAAPDSSLSRRRHHGRRHSDGSARRNTARWTTVAVTGENVLLDVVDQKLEKRGHRFVRFANDCNIYVKSKRALGIAAKFGRSWWHVAAHTALHIAFPKPYFHSLGVPLLGPS